MKGRGNSLKHAGFNETYNELMWRCFYWRIKLPWPWVIWLLESKQDCRGSTCIFQNVGSPQWGKTIKKFLYTKSDFKNFQRFQNCKLSVLSKITWLSRPDFETHSQHLEQLRGSRLKSEVLSNFKQSHVTYTYVSVWQGMHIRSFSSRSSHVSDISY